MHPSGTRVYHRTVMRTTTRDTVRAEWAIVRQIELAMRSRKLSNVAVARELGMRESSIRMIRNGVNRPNLATIARLMVWEPERFEPYVIKYLRLLGQSLVPDKATTTSDTELVSQTSLTEAVA